MMDALELQAIRYTFTVTVEEGARYAARDNNVVARQQWEKGEKETPGDIIRICSEMKARRKLGVNAVIDKINNRIGNNTMRSFPNLNAFQVAYHYDGFPDWETYQSTIIELYAHDLGCMC